MSLRGTARLARLQARLAPWPLFWAGLSMAGASCALVLLVALGAGVRQAADLWLGEVAPPDTFDVVAPAANAAFELTGGTALDERVRADLAALPQVRRATAVYDLPLPLLAEGGGALFGRPLRADVLLVGLDEDVVTHAAQRRCPDAPELCLHAPFAAPSDGQAPLPVVVHPGLLATYNATVAPSLGLPSLSAAQLQGLCFTVYVGSSHLPGRAKVRQAGQWTACVAGLSQNAPPLGLGIPAESGLRLWHRYVDAAAAPPLGRVQLQAVQPSLVPPLQRRLRKMGLVLDDDAARLRATAVLGHRLLAGLGVALFLLAGGYGAQALRAHLVGQTRVRRLLRVLGHGRLARSGAAALQALCVASLGALGGAVLARLCAGLLQAAVAHAAAAWQVAPPQLFVFAARVDGGITILLGLVSAGASWLSAYLDKAWQPG